MLDVKHSEAWNREAIAPLVADDPRRAAAMAEGALIRLKCGERCFERYRAISGREMIEADEALLTLLAQLQHRGYRFVAPTPATHAIVLGRPVARDLRDIFGWSLPFAREVVADEIFDLLRL